MAKSDKDVPNIRKLLGLAKGQGSKQNTKLG